MGGRAGTGVAARATQSLPATQTKAAADDPELVDTDDGGGRLAAPAPVVNAYALFRASVLFL